MKIDTPFKCNYAILDVKKGRKTLEKRIKKGEKIKIFVEMILDTVSSDDDSISIEFSGEVLSVKQNSNV